MKKLYLILPVIMLFFITARCTFINNYITTTYKTTTENFIKSLIKENYDETLDYMAINKYTAKSTELDTLKIGLANFRHALVNEYGEDLDFSFIQAAKKFSTLDPKNDTPKGNTDVIIEFSNKKDCGIFNIRFDDHSRKILNIDMLNVKRPIPSMTLYWVIGLIAICIPVFNIYMIIKIKRSDLKKKWIKYIAVIFLNVPTLTYTIIDGFSYKLLNFQLLGTGFSFSGYFYSYWILGFPLGALYWLWRLHERANLKIEDSVEWE